MVSKHSIGVSLLRAGFRGGTGIAHRQVAIACMVFLAPWVLGGQAGLLLTPEEVRFGRVVGDHAVVGALEIGAREGELAVIEEIRPLCSCIEVTPETGGQAFPVSLEGDARLVLMVVLDPEGLDGPIRKLCMVKYRLGSGKAGGDSALQSFAVCATVGAGDWLDAGAGVPETAPATAGPARPWKSWDYGHDVASLDGDMLIFSAAGCAECDWLRLEWLPRFEAEGFAGKAYWVDLDDARGIRLLTKIETDLHCEGTDVPVVYYRRELFHGTERIARIAVRQEVVPPAAGKP